MTDKNTKLHFSCKLRLKKIDFKLHLKLSLLNNVYNISLNVFHFSEKTVYLHSNLKVLLEQCFSNL
jgi:hypothetical protein